MMVLKIIFSIVVCVPIIALAAYLFERSTEDAMVGTHQKPRKKKSGKPGILKKLLSKKKRSDASDAQYNESETPGGES